MISYLYLVKDNFHYQEDCYERKVLDNKKNGMGMMVLFILLYAVAAAAVIFGAAFRQIPLMVIGIIWASLGWIRSLALKC